MMLMLGTKVGGDKRSVLNFLVVFSKYEGNGGTSGLVMRHR